MDPLRNHHFGSSSRTQMWRKPMGGEGSPCAWSLIGADLYGLYLGAPRFVVSPVSCTWFCTRTPLWITVTNAGLVSVPSAANVGAVQMTSKLCHAPGSREELIRGGACL